MFIVVDACPSYWGMDNNCHGIVANVLVSDHQNYVCSE
jgi:hypothetical protein